MIPNSNPVLFLEEEVIRGNYPGYTDGESIACETCGVRFRICYSQLFKDDAMAHNQASETLSKVRTILQQEHTDGLKHRTPKEIAR
jgi:hypothetical protein